MSLILSGSNGITSPDGTVFSGVDHQLFNASGTWTKPSGGVVAYIQAWGTGGGGARRGTGNGAGGGGGGYWDRWMLLSDLGSTETVTIGAGTGQSTDNTAGVAGGTTSFGSDLIIYGGRGGAMGADGAAVKGGGAGGPYDVWSESGTNHTSSLSGDQTGNTVVPEGGVSASLSSGPGTGATGTSVVPDGHTGIVGGGGGGGHSTAGSASGPGGLSELAGAGGAGAHGGAGVAGTAPGGGGGSGSASGGAGAVGRIIVTVI